MLDTYIKHKGIAKTIIHENNKNVVNEMEWDADYDGQVANMDLGINNNGNKQHYSFKLDNEDLASILNIPSVNQTLDMRLKHDFKDENIYSLIQPKIIEIEPNQDLFFDKSSLMSDNNFQTHISSPLPYEELIIPLKINPSASKSYTLTPKRRHKKRKNHRTHKVYKHKKTSSRRSKNSNTRSYKRKTSSIPRL
jgi:hypothetical protein